MGYIRQQEEKKKMTEHKYLTNQQLLKELEQRLPDFTLKEMTNLSKLLMTNMSQQHKELALEQINKISPQFHNSVSEFQSSRKKNWRKSRTR